MAAAARGSLNECCYPESGVTLIQVDYDGVDQATGVCSWLEIYALGASTPRHDRPRHVTQILNLNDTCCFGGTVYTSYASQLEKRVNAIGTGTWQLFSDDSHRGHAISSFAIEKVLIPAIERMQEKPMP